MVSSRGARAFTLAELLVVVAIIGILTALAIPVMSGVRRRSQTKATAAFMERIRLALESYSNDFGDYPPSQMTRAGVTGANELNAGSELLVRCLTTSAKAGPYLEFDDASLGNTDGDSLSGSANPTKSVIRAQDLFEVVDVWGNPIMYLHNRDYERGCEVSLPGGNVNVRGYEHEKTKQFAGLTTFQLWSAGVDGVAGTDDDVRVFGE